MPGLADMLGSAAIEGMPEAPMEEAAAIEGEEIGIDAEISALSPEQAVDFAMKAASALDPKIAGDILAEVKAAQAPAEEEIPMPEGDMGGLGGLAGAALA